MVELLKAYKNGNVELFDYSTLNKIKTTDNQLMRAISSGRFVRGVQHINIYNGKVKITTDRQFVEKRHVFSSLHTEIVFFATKDIYGESCIIQIFNRSGQPIYSYSFNDRNAPGGNLNISVSEKPMSNFIMYQVDFYNSQTIRSLVVAYMGNGIIKPLYCDDGYNYRKTKLEYTFNDNSGLYIHRESK